MVPIAELAASLFYGRLFALDPALRSLFSNDTIEQGQKLMTTLRLVVDKLHQPEEILGAVQSLGRRHSAYGVVEKDYDTVGLALLWALDKGLGVDFSTAVREAWAAAYGLLAGVMLDAAGPMVGGHSLRGGAESAVVC